MNMAMKRQIISELDTLTDTKAASLLDYLHFLKQEKQEYYPNTETIEALNEDKSNFKSYSSAEEIFDDLGIDY